MDDQLNPIEGEVFMRLIAYLNEAKAEGTIGWGIKVTQDAARDIVAIVEAGRANQSSLIEKAQVEYLAGVLMKEFGGPDRSESAVEMAIRVLREQRVEIDRLNEIIRDRAERDAAWYSEVSERRVMS